jgi:hypothetical protein
MENLSSQLDTGNMEAFQATSDQGSAEPQNILMEDEPTEWTTVTRRNREKNGSTITKDNMSAQSKSIGQKSENNLQTMKSNMNQEREKNQNVTNRTFYPNPDNFDKGKETRIARTVRVEFHPDRGPYERRMFWGI